MSTGPLAHQGCKPQGTGWHSLEEWGGGHAGGSAPFPPTREPRGPSAGQVCAPPCAGGGLPHSPQGPPRLSLAWRGLKPCNRPQSDMARQSHRTLVLGPFSVQCVAPGTCLWTWPLSEQNWGCFFDRLSWRDTSWGRATPSLPRTTLRTMAWSQAGVHTGPSVLLEGPAMGCGCTRVLGPCTSMHSHWHKPFAASETLIN